MADKPVETTVETKAAPADEWDSPSHHVEAVSGGVAPAEPDDSKAESSTASASGDAPAADDKFAALAAQFNELKEMLTAQKSAEPAKPKREPLKVNLELPESLNFDPEATKAFQSAFDNLAEQFNKRETEREQEHDAALKKLGALESDNNLSKQARANMKMLDALPNDHYRAVFEGDEANDNSEAVARKMDVLRAGYKAAGGKLPSERALFTEAAVGLFHVKAEELRAKGGRPRKDRTISSVTPAANGQAKTGRAAALATWNRIVRENGLQLPVATEADFQSDDRGY